jgi:hypothetical protein
MGTHLGSCEAIKRKEMSTRPDTNSVIAGLKDFQRATVDYVFDRFYGENPTRRFLVADEVGLGKTLVARGLIARTIDHLWETVDRIDVIYVCSNADIARQNVQRLNIPGCNTTTRSTRLTLLPLEIQDLGKNRVNFIAFTPATSFNQNDDGGRVDERILLYWLLDKAWGIQGSRKPLNVLCEYVGVTSFERQLNRFDRSRVNKPLARAFVQELKTQVAADVANDLPGLRQRFKDLQRDFRRSDVDPGREARSRRSRWIGDVRRLLARVCLNALQPDLIIFDEFQRFTQLLDKESNAGELAQALFDSGEGVGARLLLLSATPYKSLSLHHEKESDAPNEFVTLVESLEDNPGGDFHCLLDSYRTALPAIRGPEGLTTMREARDKIQERLRRIMVRTEKSMGDLQQVGMLTEPSPAGMSMTTADVKAFLGTQVIAEHIGAGDMVEYWKSSPYLFNFMEQYTLKRAFKEWTKDLDLIRLVKKQTGAFLNLDAIQSYRKVDPANARLRSLEDQTVGRGMWRLLWLPPALGYYKPAGPYAEPSLSDITKRLVFSSWHVVPRSVASLLSYEAERRMMCSLSPNGKPTMEQRQKQKALLQFTDKSGRLTGLPLFTLLYPCLTFARECDPRALATGKWTARGVLGILGKHLRQITSELKLPSTKEGKTDERWYWILPMLLDEERYSTESLRWWTQEHLASKWSESGIGGTDAWVNHVAKARETLQNVRDRKITLGPRPHDLFEVLALTASAGPATAAYRALGRTSEKPIHNCQESRLAAARVGWAFLSLFNHPEVTYLIRAEIRKGAYWRRVLAYAHGGQIQAVLDEYVHVLAESIGGSFVDAPERVNEISAKIIQSIGLRASPLSADHIEALPHSRAITISDASMRLRFAMRFGEEKEDDDPAVIPGSASKSSRKERVRAAFNSPFWPFVLVSTSVGQEGLDFHHYCHAITHWNLPANPVDLEQREGRIHRYKGHAIRKNVAAAYGAKALKGTGRDPWADAFDMAVRKRRRGENDLVPYWHFPGAAMIERHVPALPFSRETDRIESLRNALVIYRMVLGQSRQEDLITYLLSEIPEAEHAAIVAELRINLSPPSLSDYGNHLSDSNAISQHPAHKGAPRLSLNL